MTRRAVLPALAAAAVTTIALADRPAPMPGGRWRLLYVGADDCIPCRAWRQAHWAALRSAPPFAGLQFIEVRAERSEDLLQDSYWPEDLRRYRSAIPSGAGVPLWMLLHGETVLVRAWGAQQWYNRMLPALRHAARGDGPLLLSS